MVVVVVVVEIKSDDKDFKISSLMMMILRIKRDVSYK